MLKLLEMEKLNHLLSSPSKTLKNDNIHLSILQKTKCRFFHENYWTTFLNKFLKLTIELCLSENLDSVIKIRK